MRRSTCHGTGPVIALGVAVALVGCTFEPGTGFGRFDTGTLHARLELGPARAVDARTMLTDRGHRVRLDVVEVHVDSVAFDAAAGRGATAFDPARPPPGYTLCHGGHCHHEDGRLVSYEEIERELAGGEAAFRTVVRADVGRPLDAVRAETAPLGPWWPSAELPEMTLARARIAIRSAKLEGAVSPSVDGETWWPLRLELSAATTATARVGRTIDRDGAYLLRPHVTLAFGGTLFDGIDLPAAVRDGRIDVSDPEAPLARALAERIAALRPLVVFEEVESP
ncbi:MAG: hypothetical protein NZ898_09800 [Myxococcota bacterium]|nr:hypothetical protein [Myxococcota bacterium]MDW8363542.1 hypothetical protein [Myxococcales bacterium]